MRLLIAFIFLSFAGAVQAQHPVTFLNRQDALDVRMGLNRYPVLTSSYNNIKSQVDAWLGKEVDVPYPKDPAGGYTHDRHKANYILMFNAGLLYNITGDRRYATLVKDILLKYAVLNPALSKHPQATSSSPGHIFWQALNDANWLVYAGIAYDLVHNSLTSAERKRIEEGAFKPEVDYLTKDLASWFDLIHNHGVWACAGVGIVGIATDNKDYVDMALYGTKKDGKSGFLAQLDGLFSPDGYYTEGPYYVRYAILPYYLFANALHRSRPTLGIFRHRDSILRKALLAGLQQTNLDGTFFPLNDALKEKDYTTNELVTAVDIAWDVYGRDSALLYVAGKQNQVLLSRGGVSIAKEMATSKKLPEAYPYRSIEYTDGVKGDEGGISLLRAGTGKDLTTLIYKYSAHGLSHGHYDKLNFNLFDKGNEIISDYGSVRFIGVEQKYGGRYLPENTRYASQTVAHNTLVVDETSHFNAKEEIAEKYHSDKVFSDISKKAVQVVAAKEENAYSGVKMNRTLYLLDLPGGQRLVADLFRVKSATKHQYDLPFHYKGHFISAGTKYEAFTRQQQALGEKNGYQFLWKEAQANVSDTLAQLTFLNGRTYYSISSLIRGKASLFFTRSGAGDPNFNIRHEPSYVIRQQADNATFVNLVEIHGKFDPVAEFSSGAYSAVKQIKLLIDTEAYTVAEIMIGGKRLLIAQANADAKAGTRHQLPDVGNWQGPYAVWYDGKQL